MGAFVDKAEQAALLDQILRAVPRNLKERVHQQAGTMSGGEQRMLAIGRADEQARACCC